ncbi:amidohydrolase family protein [uncultured Phenylobacterium sp.]|uniref:N-acyl-D-amino-acid deacylase family protein n=1 Tax=uncultured Phenylobacterium sp. TaxID=349273 RepID=UPI0025F17C1B|nr:amidohydrolase family protein [uncultured Phenylobacterium sp.]
MAAQFDRVIRGGTIADGTGGDLLDADIGISDGVIAAIGKDLGAGREEIGAKGLLVTPGFVDVHTHYDGQLTWSDRLTPSSNHGVTTVVTGNCGVGFAPCREADRENLVRLMEGVEDIPEVVMAEGLPWDWNSFPDFLQSIERKPHDIDYAVLLPHSPLRVFVMGERAVRLEPATEADRAAMRQLTKEAMLAGAAGFGTSRNILHQASDGKPIPSMAAEEAELTAIAMGMADAGRGQMQAITVTQDPRIEDFELFHRVARSAGRRLSYTLVPIENRPRLWREVMDSIRDENASGGDVKAQVFNRPVGIILGLETNHHAFSAHPLYVERLSKLPLEQRVAEMQKPEVRAALLGFDGRSANPLAGAVGRLWNRMFPMGETANYEPDPSTSVAAQAAAKGVSPESVAYDLLLEAGGRAKLLVAATGYAKGNLDEIRELLTSENAVLALGDGGAHYGLICGRVGLKADLNVIDLDRLKLSAPVVVRDLPAGGRRLTQEAAGYVATLVAGEPIQRDGAPTDARPGRMVRNAGI